MSHKEYPDFHAKPINEAIDKIVPMLDRMLNNKIAEEDHAQLFQVGPIKGREQLAKKLKEMANPDVCVTSSQEDSLLLGMLDYLNNPEETKLFAIATFINSCRVECSHCLNGRVEGQKPCKMRDILDVPGIK